MGSPRVALVQHAASLTGSSFSALMLAEGLREGGAEVEVVLGLPGPFADRFRGEGFRVQRRFHRNWLRTRHPLRFARNVGEQVRPALSLTRLLAAQGAEVVYVNTAVSLAGALAGRLLGLPVVWHLRELFDDVGGELRTPPSCRGAVGRVFRGLADRVVVNSSAVAANLLGATGSCGAVVVPNAVEANFFTPPSAAAARVDLGLSLEDTVIGVPGSLRPMKGHPFFFRAVAPILRSRADLVVAVSGTGEAPYVREVRALCEELGLTDRVRFLGDQPDMRSFYAACDVVCVPSVAEPFGRTVIEAFAAGVPIVATEVGGIPETLEHGRTGLLVPYGDEAALRDALTRLLDDGSLRQRLADAAQDRAAAEFPASRYKARLRDVVEEARRARARRPTGRQRAIAVLRRTGLVG